jgi:hypothetical protein
VAKKYNLATFFKNRLMLGMGAGILLNITGLPLLKFPTLGLIEPFLTMFIILMICIVVGSQIQFRIATNILISKFFWIFWSVRIAGTALSIYFHMPVALTVLFILPPSFLMPVIYTELHEKEKKYAANFIAAALPITLILWALLSLYFGKI